MRKHINDEVQLNPSPKRLEVIEEYSKVFGGTVEENTLILREKTVKEIKASIENQKEKEQVDNKRVPSERPDKNSPSARKNTSTTENTDTE